MHLSDFEIGEEIGSGGESWFCRARRTSDGQRVLLRAATNGAGAVLERELEICRDVDVDGVLAALDLIDDGGRAVLVLDDAPGMSLDRLLAGDEPLPLAGALEIGVQLAGLLSALHQRDLIHRDLRPANVVYDRESGQVSLTGLGRASQVPRVAWRIRPSGRLEGDPAYTAPEATGRLNRQLDYRADIYSLGVVLFQMLTGRLPFDATDPLALVYAHIALEPPDPGSLQPGLPAPLPAIVGELLAKAAEDRYQSGLGLRYDLKRCLADLETKGSIRPFTPGELDVAERFELPQKLFGRDAELQWLELALAGVATEAAAVTGRKSVRLVAGTSGVGKTALIEEIRLSVLGRRGLFASGTFDPGSSATPYGGVLSALSGLVQQRLGAERQQVRVWRQRLVSELGANLGVLTEALPELLSLVGEAPSLSEVPAENARNRFHGCVERFLATLAARDGDGAPVVIFLDDLQWVDSASVELLERLLTGDEASFLLLGAYRDNEVDEDHLLARTVARLAARGVDVDTLRLPPLAEPDLTRLVAEALRLPPTETAPLGELVYRKTAGNAFFARTFLSTLYQSGLLLFSTASGASVSAACWTWDLEAMGSLEATENVIELVAHRLTELPATRRLAVAVASILGKEFDAEILAATCGADEGMLIELCRDGLLVQVGDSSRYAFVHDRVWEGANELLQEAERADVHLQIGRLLRDRDGCDLAVTGSATVDRACEAPRAVFEIADHLNQAAHLLTDPEERRSLVMLNAEAGRQARASGAFATAYAYLSGALGYLGAEVAVGEEVPNKGAGPWQEDYELTRTLYGEAAEAASLAGDFEAAERLAEVLRDNARSMLDAVPAYETRIYVLHARREVETALCLSLEVLSGFGMKIPIVPEASEVEAAVTSAEAAVESVLAAVTEHGIRHLPVMRDPEVLAVSRLLARTVFMAAWTRMRLLRLAACRLAELSAIHGVGSVSPVAYLMMAEVRCGELGDVAGGRRVGELGLQLARHLGASGVEATCRFLFDGLVEARTVHPAVLRDRFAELARRNLESGDFLAVAGCGVHRSIAGFIAGTRLTEVAAAAREDHGRVRGLGQLIFAHAIDGVARLAEALLGRGTVGQAVEIAGLPSGAVASVRSRLVGPEMMARFLLRQRQAALRAARESLALPDGVLPIFPLDFYRCLIFLECGGEDQPELDACHERLERRARAAPEIYQHKLDLVRAYVKRAAGAHSEALALCEAAVEGARENRFPHEEAMARELAAELCLAVPKGREQITRGRERVAAAYLRATVAAYRQWGARAKVDQLFETYPDLTTAPDDPFTPLDVTSLERAQGALSSELDLARLLRQLMTLLLQNTGARRGFLLRGARPGDAVGGLRIEASGIGSEVELPEDLELAACDEIAATVVRFVARTQEIVILGDARRDARFASDPYIERARPRSILCFPLQHRGETVEIVYLENDHSRDVFSSERSTAARLLASHAAAALENARLHHSLKQEVEIRRRAEADLAVLKDRLEAENVYLQEEIQSHFEEIVGDSEPMRKVLYKVEQVAATDATVLILGETGTGKELIARALHRLSPRRERPLVKVNCAALPTTLIESELFGHEKGAFTGALSRKAGRFELADSGTLFLDEIGDLPLELQAKLLRVLQEGEFERLGGARTMKVDVRIIAATNRDLEQAMADGTFRSDLYYRLTVFPIELPPLKTRHGDVPLLVHYFVDRKRGKLGKPVEKIPQEVMARLDGYAWPGNVRELENVVERALILSPGDTLRLEESFGAGKTAPAGPERLVDLERAHITAILEACDWKVKGEGNAADRLGLTPPTLRNRMKKLGIVRPGG